MSVTIVPGQKLTELTAISSIALTDLLYVVKAGNSTSFSSTLSVLKDSLVGPLTSTFLPLAGGTMTGSLTLTGVPITTNNAATKGYVDAAIASVSAVSFIQNFLPLSGGTMTGGLTLTGVPIATNNAATKGYVDTNFLSLASGGTLSGALILNGNPTTTNQAATKAYVDSITGTKITVKTLGANRCGDVISNSGRVVNYIIDNKNTLRCSGLFGNGVWNGGMGAYSFVIDGFRPSAIQYLTTTEYALSVLSSGYSTWVLSNSGTVYSAGRNEAGILGLGDARRRNIFTALTSIALSAEQIAVSSGYIDSAAVIRNSVFVIDKSKNLWAWGSNGTGQLGFANAKGAPAAGNNSTYFYSPCAVNVGGTSNKIKSVVTTGYYSIGSTYAILTGSQLYVTGYNNNGQLGLGDTANRASFTLVPNISADAIYTSSTGYVTYIVRNGTLSAAGDNTSGNLGNGQTGAKINNLTFQTVFSADSTGGSIGAIGNVKSISVNDGYKGAVSVYALTNDNRVFAWGNNGGGQLGFGDKKNRLYATQVATATKVETIGYGATATTTIFLSAGSIYVAGYVSYGIDGQGDGPDGYQTIFQKVIQPQGVQWVDFEGQARQIGDNERSILAVDTFGNLWAWGSNLYSELGLNIGAGNRVSGNYRLDVPMKIGIVE